MTRELIELLRQFHSGISAVLKKYFGSIQFFRNKLLENYFTYSNPILTRIQNFILLWEYQVSVYHNTNIREMAIFFAPVHAVTYQEFIRSSKAQVINFNRNLPAGGFIHQGTEFN